MKKYIFLVWMILLSMLLCSCGGKLYDGFCGVLGIDNTDYASEDTLCVLDTDDDIASDLAQSAKILCYGQNIITFDNFSDCSYDYIDIILNYLSGSYYSKYCADKTMLKQFSREYPDMAVNSLIPLKDYENTVYTYFGGSKKAVIGSTVSYSYLDKIDAFVSVGKRGICSVDCTVTEAEETENTYRLTVDFDKNGEFLGTYDIIFKKRDFGQPYILSVKSSEKILTAKAFS